MPSTPSVTPPFATVTVDGNPRHVYTGPIKLTGYVDDKKSFFVTCAGERISVVNFIGKHGKLFKKAGEEFFPKRKELRDLCEIYQGKPHNKEVERQLYEDADNPSRGIAETGYAIWHRADKKVIGRIVFGKTLEEFCPSMEIILNPKYRGKKYAPEALYQMLYIVDWLGRKQIHFWEQIYFFVHGKPDSQTIDSCDKLLVYFKAMKENKNDPYKSFYLCEKAEKRIDELRQLHIQASQEPKENGPPAPPPEDGHYGEFQKMNLKIRQQPVYALPVELDEGDGQYTLPSQLDSNPPL